MKNSALSIFVLVSIVLFVSCTSGGNGETNANEKYKVISPLVKDTVYTNEYVAEINAFQNVEIRARVNGFIENIHVDEGETVYKGQLLFTISSQKYKQDLQKAKAILQNANAELKSAEIDLENAEKLLEKKIVAETDLEMMKTKVDAMKAKVAEAQSDEEQAQLNLSFAQVKAPFDGIINRIPNKAGSLADEGTLLTTISDNKEVFAYFNVSEIDYLNYVVSSEKGESKEVSLMLANNTLFANKGIIETTESEFDHYTGTIAFRAKFPNPTGILKHGASGKVLVNSFLPNAILIPQQCVFEVQENLYLYVIDKDNTIKQRQIIAEMRLGNMYLVTEGLSETDIVLYEGIQLIKEGDKIIPDFIVIPN